jgi:filamentous hemagglutinin family protein
MKSNIALALAIAVPLISLVHSQAVTAQVASDSRLSTTVNSTDGVNFTIENGDRAGSNLFHSFREFSVPTGGSANFNNAVDVQNIFSRVTGSNVSNIDGLIRANGTANLFLLNPNGIVFGPNAQLNIGGSFLGTTATSIRFADAVEFSATNPQTTALLTVSTPVGLRMGRNPAPITVQGAGHTLRSTRTSAPYQRSPVPGLQPGLQVGRNQMLALIGGDLTLQGAVLTAPQGRIALGSLGNSATDASVGIEAIAQGWNFDYNLVPLFGTMTLNQAALLDASDNGSIQLQGRNISFTNGAVALIQNTTAIPTGGIQVNASGELSIAGMSPNRQIRSGLQQMIVGTGNGGPTRVAATTFTLTEGGAIRNFGFGLGATGNIAVNAGSIQIQGFSNAGSSSIVTNSFGAGAVGSVQVTANQLSLKDGALLGSLNTGTGLGGNITVEVADLIEIGGVNTLTQSAANIGASSFRSGNAGVVSVTTDRLVLNNGGRVTSGGFAQGNAGDTVVTARRSIEISDPRSSIDSSVDILPASFRTLLGLPAVPTGNAGSVTINTPLLNLTNQGLVSVRSDGPGNAGRLRINADRIVLNQRAAITASTNSGKGGDIELQAEDLILRNSGQVNASTLSGQGGDMQLRIRDRLQIDTQGRLLANAQQAGQGGNISIAAANLSLNRGGRITSDAQGTATGGSLRIQGDRLSLLAGSSLSAVTGGSGAAGNVWVSVNDINISGVANTEIAGVGLTSTPSFIGSGTFPNSSGRGGRLRVVSDRMTISDGGLISAGTSGAGAAGDMSIRANESIEVTGRSDRNAPFFGYQRNHPSRISASSLTDAPAGSVQIQTPLLNVSNGALIEVSDAGRGGAGNLTISADRINLSDRARLAAEVAGGDRGNITLNANLINLRRNSQITTNATGSASGGNINLNSQFILGLENSDIVARAQQGSGGRIAIATQGLIGLEPRLALTPESDINASSQVGLNGTINISNPNVDPESGVVELPTELVDASQQVAQVCGGAQDNQFVATGRGGVPVDPSQALGGDRAWSDLRNIARDSSEVEENLPRTTLSNVLNEAIALTEASGWRVNGQGQVELVAVQHSVPNGFAAASCEAVL